ncbi:MAG: tetratricopeptide repeat protein [Nitrospirota bacterium]
MTAEELLGKAQLLFVDGKHRESIGAFTEALEAGANAYIVHLSRGVAYLNLKELDNAINDLHQAINANDKSARAYYYRGMIFMAKEDFERAIADFTQSLELKPDLHIVKFARATAYARLRQYDNAAADFKAVLPQMEVNLQSFTDTYGIVRTAMWKVMAQMDGEATAPEWTASEIEAIKRWLGDEQ